jgi:hypothetical protein
MGDVDAGFFHVEGGDAHLDGVFWCLLRNAVEGDDVTYL